jgi:hypothetical protein
MYARAIDDASTRLRRLRREEQEDLALAAAAIALALVATQVHGALALPLFLGGVFVGALGVRAMWRHWDLLEHLAGERDAYSIDEVRAYASREATMSRRRNYAAIIRGTLTHSGGAADERLVVVADDLEALALELLDDELALDPACAVYCMRLVTDPEASPLLNPGISREELRSRITRIRSGFTTQARTV